MSVEVFSRVQAVSQQILLRAQNDNLWLSRRRLSPFVRLRRTKGLLE